MASIPAIAQPEITVINSRAVTSSLAIADYFTKRHDDVLKRIRALECSPEFNHVSKPDNFVPAGFRG